MAMGTAVGGWKIISTMGTKIFKLETINGFAADLNSAITIFTATFLHLPVSTTHVVSGSLLGVGSSKRIKAVNWGGSKIYGYGLVCNDSIIWHRCRYCL